MSRRAFQAQKGMPRYRAGGFLNVAGFSTVGIVEERGRDDKEGVTKNQEPNKTQGQVLKDRNLSIIVPRGGGIWLHSVAFCWIGAR